MLVWFGLDVAMGKYSSAHLLDGGAYFCDEIEIQYSNYHYTYYYVILICIPIDDDDDGNDNNARVTGTREKSRWLDARMFLSSFMRR